MGRRGEDFEVESEGSGSEGDESKGGEDAEKGHIFAESDEEADVEEGQLYISGWYLLEHNYYDHIFINGPLTATLLPGRSYYGKP